MLLDSEYDVVVAGGGPGGSVAAKKCAELGLKVAMLEKLAEIGTPKRCGEGMSFDFPEGMADGIPRNCIAQEIDGFHIYSPSGKKFVLDMEKTSGYVLERKQYDKWLAEEAARAGAKVQSKTSVTGVINEGGSVSGVKAEFEGETMRISSKVLVAADGIESTVARMAGIRSESRLGSVGSGLQFEMVGLELDDPKKLEIYKGNKIAPGGYVWVFPKGEDKANVGIGISRMENGNASMFLKKFVMNTPFLRKGSITEVNAGSIPIGDFLESISSAGIVVVGDAAHQSNPIHGGGMGEAYFAASLVAGVIKECFEKNDFSSKALSVYDRLWWEKRGNYLKKVERIKDVLVKLSDDDFEIISESISRGLLLELSTGNDLQSFAKILIKNPRLITLAKHLV